MTGNLLEDNPKGLLILILPLAVAIIFVYQFWYIILALFILSLIWQIWQNYQWQQWNLQINPVFNELIIENQGCLTPLDLSVKANLTAKVAQRFLDRKAEEYGAQKKLFDEQGIIYYFLTANALQSIFEDSDYLYLEDKTIDKTTAVIEQDQKIDSDYDENIHAHYDYEEDEEAQDNYDYEEDEDLEEDETANLGILSLSSALDDIEEDEEDTHHEISVAEMAQLLEVKEDAPLPSVLQEEDPQGTSVSKIAQLVELNKEQNLEVKTTDKIDDDLINSNATLTTETEEQSEAKSQKPVNYQSLRLKQNELAKRLDIHYNTIGKRKSDLDFPQWSQKRDPEGIAWEYLPKIRVFAPVELDEN
jgi:hypothetical protein